MKNISVIGAGIMGHGIAQLAALAGYNVVLRDMNNELLEKGKNSIEISLDRMIKSEKITESQKREALYRIQLETDLKESVKYADLVIEAIPEELSLKQDLFEQLDEFCSSETILATNTSQLSVTLIGAKVSRRDKMIGTHFFNPAVVMKLVEIIKGLETSEDTLQKVESFCQSIGKDTVVCQKDTQGFITTRLLLAQRSEAFRLVEEGVATIEDVDKAMRLAFKHPLGPFQLADLAGLDTGLKALSAMEDTFGDRFKAPTYLKQMVALGYYGKKNGKGFYNY
ncbi:3-hydroxyacyl-CoA dehydrogenase family protein [Salinibacillus xinjiangensis]|uniref:3-hydroxybutyryl-CoA dehydrogenase n=1 Tax=Salinibacillus xinjiangensis TaxID=1229268 RepID=A0A6G1X1S0_9BACI|nr:3-hydroxyacyl-CoA dehydrogenase family protein [Salinibacillus xinjiangensis]MRG84884.1 3-hydroxybutyryl-CoA dehydrogenase [Salinibacillus xinjiangensis]